MKFVCGHCGKPTDNTKVYGNLVFHTCDECQDKMDREIDWQSENEHFRENTIICPYCDYEYEAYDSYRYDEGEETEIECPECGRKFDLEVENIRYFSTKRSLCEMPTEKGGAQE